VACDSAKTAVTTQITTGKMRECIIMTVEAAQLGLYDDIGALIDWFGIATIRKDEA
jgi:hypothetical protein